jgi:hypothetical protein
LQVEPVLRQPTTQRFELVRSGIAPAVPGTAADAGAGGDASTGDAAAAGPAAATEGSSPVEGAVPEEAANPAAAAAYEFEYKDETCVGEIEEGLGGTLRW